MRIDDARRHDVAVGLDGLARVLMQPAERGDLAARDAHVGTKTRHPRSVDDSAVANDDVVHGFSMALSASRRNDDAASVGVMVGRREYAHPLYFRLFHESRLADKRAAVSRSNGSPDISKTSSESLKASSHPR